MCLRNPPSISPRSAQVRWHVIASSNWLSTALAWINQAAEAALAARGRFDLVLAGGGTPQALYRALAEQPQDWARWQIWYGDERCLPAADPQRNSRMAETAWLDRIIIPTSNIRVIPAELGAQAAAQAYTAQLSGHDLFDLVLLGLGQDGHTASLFPDHTWGVEPDSPDVLAVFDAPKPPPERVTLSAHRLSRTRSALILIRGADKHEALTNWQQGATIPASAIQPESGIDLLIDQDACPPGELK